MSNKNNECSVCGACGCGTALYLVKGVRYCKRHLPTPEVKQDDQVLTPEQKAQQIKAT